MEYAMISAPAAPVRRKARHSSEMVNQLLFGEVVLVLRRKNELWVRVKSLHDGYEGWLTTTLIDPLKEYLPSPQQIISAELLSRIQLGERILHIPFGSLLSTLNNEDYAFGGRVMKPGLAPPSVMQLCELALTWLNVPYLWGGRTPLGIDCSGLVQVLFSTQGIFLPRDAWQQAQSGTLVKKFRDARPGDLLFFDEKEEIVHVGILVEPGVMIHSSGRVRLDPVDKKGMVNAEIRSRKLKLQMIRRHFA